MEEVKKCYALVPYKDQFNFHAGYSPCTNKPAYKVSCLGIRGKTEIKLMCKVHYNALVKNAARIQKRNGYDCKVEVLEKL